MPILLGTTPNETPNYPALLTRLDAELVHAVTESILMSGLGENAELMLLEMLDHGRMRAGDGWAMPTSKTDPLPRRSDWVDPLARMRALANIMAESSSTRARQRARRSLRSGMGRYDKLQRVAEAFAWGVRLGRQLTGKLFTLEMIAGEELGYTRLNEHKLYITPLPLLRSEQSGKEVVRGLILHEYGHHLYHKGENAQAIWDQAERRSALSSRSSTHSKPCAFPPHRASRTRPCCANSRR